MPKPDMESSERPFDNCFICAVQQSELTFEVQGRPLIGARAGLSLTVDSS